MKRYVNIKTAKFSLETSAQPATQMETVKNTLRFLGQTASVFFTQLRPTAIAQTIIQVLLTAVALQHFSIHVAALLATAPAVKHATHST